MNENVRKVGALQTLTPVHLQLNNEEELEDNPEDLLICISTDGILLNKKSQSRCDSRVMTA